jgi:16S rRNA (cytidine1402-2'-O)-methyltransferase
MQTENEKKNCKLSLVATPIGNLEDITLRAIRTLKECDLIACENTSNAQRLLKHYEIDTPTTVFFSNSKLSHIDRIMKTLEEGGHVSLISDAGTPCISDPGVLILNKVRVELPNCIIESIPGASALTVAVSLAGIVGNRFTFLGFVPNKKGRETLVKSVAEDENASVMYESVHRIEKLLESFAEYMPNREVVICRELTKMYEQVVRGTAKDVSEYFKNNQDKVRGEFVVIVI